MKKILALTSLFAVSVVLTGCDADRDHKERCTELQHEATEAMKEKGERQLAEIRKEWDRLQCKLFW